MPSRSRPPHSPAICSTDATRTTRRRSSEPWGIESRKPTYALAMSGFRPPAASENSTRTAPPEAIGTSMAFGDWACAAAGAARARQRQRGRRSWTRRIMVDHPFPVGASVNHYSGLRWLTTSMLLPSGSSANAA